MEDITELEWKILDSLSDALASTADMQVQGLSLQELREKVYELYQRGILYAYNGPVEYDKLMSEPPEQVDIDNEYGFGLTELGSECWEKGSKIYSDKPVDWTKARITILYPEWGYIEGTTEEICLAALEKIPDNSGWEAEKSTIVHEEIEGFKPYYHKYLTGGHRIKFRLKKRKM
jgi:hypothetical protein